MSKWKNYLDMQMVSNILQAYDPSITSLLYDKFIGNDTSMAYMKEQPFRLSQKFQNEPTKGTQVGRMTRKGTQDSEIWSTYCQLINNLIRAYGS